jgi:ribosomal protein L29
MTKYTDILKMDSAGIQKRINEIRMELVQNRFQIVTSQLKDIKTIQKSKREIARLLTALQARKKGE